MEERTADALIPRLDWYIREPGTRVMLQVEGALGPLVRGAKAGNPREADLAESLLLGLAGKMDHYTDNVFGSLSRGNDPAWVSQELLEDLEGLKNFTAILARNDPAARNKAVNALENMQRVMHWDNVQNQAMG
jgi:hypothetical protein